MQTQWELFLASTVGLHTINLASGALNFGLDTSIGKKASPVTTLDETLPVWFMPHVLSLLQHKEKGPRYTSLNLDYNAVGQLPTHHQKEATEEYCIHVPGLENDWLKCLAISM